MEHMVKEHVVKEHVVKQPLVKQHLVRAMQYQVHTYQYQCRVHVWIVEELQVFRVQMLCEWGH